MKISVIHQTDLFHPHADPDDHWDLACQFALSKRGNTKLLGILIDYPPGYVDCGDPAFQAVGQLNYITGMNVSAAVGIPELFPKSPENHAKNSGVKMVLDTLEKSNEKIAIHIVGSCRDISVAAALRPDLFRDKCSKIYLNAGSAYSDKNSLEYNVNLDPKAYKSIFDIPCDIYWMPCFGSREFFKVATYGTYYRFLQKDILPFLSEKLQRFFIYMLSRTTDNKWLRYLEAEDIADMDKMKEEFSGKYRNMWCTGGFFHCAGLGVTKSGNIVELDSTKDDFLYTFEKVEITCDSDGVVTWNLTDKDTGRYIYKILDENAYESSMTNAMKTLLVEMDS